MLETRKQVTIGELCQFTNGNGFRPSDWKREGLPIIRIQNLNGSQEFNYFDGQPNPKWVIEPGDLLFAWAGVKGVSFGPTIWPGPRGVLNQHIFRIVPNPGVDRYWLYLALQEATRRIEANAHGFKSSLVHVHKEDITGQLVELPSSEEQRKIAELLRAWDYATVKQSALVELKLARRDRMRSWLIEKSGRSGRPCKFADFLSESRELGNDGATARKISVRLYGKGAVEKLEKIQGSANTRYYRRKCGQLIYSKLDFLNGAFAIIPNELDGLQSTLDLPAFEIADVANPRWLLEYLTRPEFYSQQVHLARGQRKARRVAPEDFLTAELKLPSREEQDHIVEILAEADREVDLERRTLYLLQQQKRGLMQKLLTGEWRVTP